MNKKGQALVEFVIILPIFLLLLFLVIDFGKILYTRISLENITNDTVRMYKNDKTYDEIKKFLNKKNKNVDFTLTNNNDEYLEFKLSEKIEITTPGLNIVLKNPYKVEVKRVVYNE